MMRIHTTQNLSSVANIQPNNLQYGTRFNLKGYPKDSVSSQPDTYEFCVAFKGKKGNLAKRIIESTKEDIKKIAEKDKNKNPNGGLFDRILRGTEKHEVFITAAIAAVLCCAVRPVTLILMSLFGDEKDKQNYKYQIAHSMSSGVFGLIFPFLFINPLAHGYNHAKAHPEKFLKAKNDEEYVKKFLDRYPQADPKTIIKDGVRQSLENIKDTSGNNLMGEIKNVMMIPLPKHISEISDETLQKIFPEVQLAGRENLETANALIDKAGNKIDYPKTLDGLCIAIEGEKDKVDYFPLKYIKDSVLEEYFPDLDIKSTLDANKKRLNLNEWKNLKGEKFEFDKDLLYVSDWNETMKEIPLITGTTRKDMVKEGLTKKKKEEVKYATYQKNGKDGELGTEITQEMVNKARASEVQDKLGGWLGDIVLAYPRATLTIVLIPFILKHILHVEKAKKEPEVATPAKVENETSRKAVA